MSMNPETGPSTLGEYALAYARMGWPVFPIRPGGKQPYPGSRGLLDATTDEALIAHWWRERPNSNIGVRTGNGLFIIDADVKDGVDGREGLADLLAEHGADTDGPMSITPSGGTHTFFRSQPHTRIKNSVGQIRPKVDVRGEGGYAIVPPSVSQNGTRYEWEASSDPLDGVRIPMAPASLQRLLSEDGYAPSPHDPDTDWDGHAKIGEGRRNDVLAKVAGLARHLGLNHQSTMEVVHLWNETVCRPPLLRSEIDATIGASAAKWKAGCPALSEGINWEFDVDAVANLKPADWLLKDYLERGTLNVTIGGWGSGKSVVELDRAMRVAYGLEWHGIKPTSGVWVYVAGEAQRGFRRRMAAWHIANDVEPGRRFVLVPELVLIGEGNANENMRNLLKEIQDKTGEEIVGVTLDTLSRCFGLESESSNSDVMRWLNSINEYITVPTNAAVSVLHHPGHMDKTRGRGASSLSGAADKEWLVEKEGNFVSMTGVKSKDNELPKSRSWRIFGVPLEIGGEVEMTPCVEAEDEEFIRPPGAAGVPEGSKQGKALDVLKRLLEEHRERVAADGRDPGMARVDRDAWFEACQAEGLAAYRAAYRNILTELKNKRLIVTDGNFVWPAGGDEG